MLSEREILEGADDRIREHRMGDVVVTVTDSAGNPVADAEVEVQQTNHAFLFGCNIFMLGRYKDDEKNRKYEELYTGLLNYATLPFYWGRFEREPDKPNYENLDWMAKRCQELGLKTKGHPLVWHEVVPAWAPADLTVLEDRLRNRVTDIVQHYRGSVDIWDVINEATVSERHDNPVGKWVKKYRDDVCVGLTLGWAREANPDAVLLVNDFNISPDFEKQLERLQWAKKPFDVIGIQSHMHSRLWDLSRAWEVCETYKRFGVPLHFTELTVVSGHLKTDSDWHKRHTDWPTTEEGEKAQLEYVQKLYRLLFSHPAMEAITWWDFPDGCWQGAPAGLVRADLLPKPIYERLVEMIKGEWWTQSKGRTDGKGEYRLRGFCGDYDVKVRESQEFFALSRGENCWAINLK
jgi:GH35 family endo-1,4-beta-xylanase